MIDTMENTKKITFNFTLGPVQGFVAQARKTRDYWAGSFLLSWLSAVAMIEVEKQGGEIVFPTMENKYRKAVTGLDQTKPPQQGGVPNQFKAKVDDNFDPAQVVAAVQIAWNALADLVWNRDIAKIARDNLNYRKKRRKQAFTHNTRFGIPDSKRVWDLQIDTFWEMNWILSEGEPETGVIGLRKNWRTHFPPPQSGTKCSLMAGWRELSGSWDKSSLINFWGDLIESLRSNDLRKSGDDCEYLCAMAFIKRRFHKHFSELEVDMPSGWKAYGWRIDDAVKSVPSVSLMAAIPWLMEVLETVPVDKLHRFAEIGELLAENGEYKTRIKGLQKKLDDNKNIPASLLTLDGAIYFPELYSSHFKNEDQKLYEFARGAIKSFDKGFASPFYAVLLMDGDSLGKLLGSTEREEGVTRALQAFCSKVPETVNERNGFLIYAGGDDVLALLPMDTALDCANDLRKLYIESFKAQLKDKPQDLIDSFSKATISAAIQFVHVHCPLTRILHDAHHLLDDIAKDGCGRDAVAISVVKTGGTVLTWAQPWSVAITTDDQWELNKLTRLLKSKDTKEKVDSEERKNNFENIAFSSKFLYGLRDLFERYTVENKEGTPTLNLNWDELKEMAWAEYQCSGLYQSEDSRQYLNRLLEQCLPHKNSPDAPDAKEKEKEKENKSVPKPDAAILIRFFASKGVII